jgi:hypothetical protein
MRLAKLAYIDPKIGFGAVIGNRKRRIRGKGSCGSEVEGYSCLGPGVDRFRASPFLWLEFA